MDAGILRACQRIMGPQNVPYAPTPNPLNSAPLERKPAKGLEHTFALYYPDKGVASNRNTTLNTKAL